MLVALPTGLGKTFIAAVLILNLYRWFPDGKIIFVAPTRPLVTQQQQACHSICGLPWDTAIELTGSTRRGLRDDEWQAKRIFYMTPQTFENDLLSTTCDPKDVIGVVVDEAHRATGNYAYCKVIRHLMYHNPHFRVLALTATPGNDAAKVQEVVTNLHISRIEIRTEDALDIQPYIHRKHEDLVVVPLGDALTSLRASWTALMQHYYEPLQQRGVLRPCDPAQLRAFAVRSAAGDRHARAILQAQPFLRGYLQQLATMAQAMQYLTEQSVRVFCERAMAMAAPGKGTTKREQLFSTSNPAFRTLVERIEAVDADAELRTHPKMHKLRDVLLGHFQRRGAPDAAHGTRAIVFCTFREVVAEIVEVLAAAGLRATQFVGQASDNKGQRGYTQKQQEEVIQAFQKGTFEVLVATSIGEEGLDIGEVDLIVCYDAIRDSVRGLQRVGRTGRLRDGRVVVLMGEGREERNWQHAKDSYKSVQRFVRDARLIELYTDVDRLVPPEIQPEPLMCEVDQPAFEPARLKPARAKPKSTARARRAARAQPPPDGGIARFCSARDMHRRDAHREGASGPAVPPPVRAPTPRSSSSSLLRTSSLAGTADLTDDSDDAELSEFVWPDTSSSVVLDKGAAPPAPRAPPATKAAPTVPVVTASTPWRDSTASSAAGALAGPATSETATSEASAPRLSVPSPTAARGAARRAPLPASPLPHAPSPRAPSVPSTSGTLLDSAWEATPPRFAPHPLIAELDTDAPPARARPPLFLDEPVSPAVCAPSSPPVPAAARPWPSPSSPPRPAAAPLSRRRAPRRAATPPRAVDVLSLSPSPEGAARARGAAATPRRKRRRRIGRSPTSRLLFRHEAERSTDEEMHGETDEDDDGPSTSEENDEDRAYVGEFEPTQQPGYEQQAVYLQSMLSQRAPSPFRRHDPLSMLLRRRDELRPSSEAAASADEYAEDSFVVNDSEISWASSGASDDWD